MLRLTADATDDNAATRTTSRPASTSTSMVSGSSRISTLETGTADVDFAFEIPPGTQEGPLDVTVGAEGKYLIMIDDVGHENDVYTALSKTIHIYSAITSRWRRIGRVALAPGAADGLFIALVAVRRRY